LDNYHRPELFKKPNHRIETKRILCSCSEGAPCARRTKKLGCRRFTTGIISQYGDLADKKNNQKNVSNWNLVPEPDLRYCRLAMNCPADQIGCTTTSTDSQNLPPDLFSNDCTFSSKQRLLDVSWRDGKIACEQRG
jgi:hypothetical protein